MVVHDNLSAVLELCCEWWGSYKILLPSLGVLDRHNTQRTFRVSIVCSLVEINFLVWGLRLGLGLRFGIQIKDWELGFALGDWELELVICEWELDIMD